MSAAKLTLTDLNLKDAPLRLHCGADEVFGRAADASEKMVAKIRRALEMSKAGALVLPLGLSGHVDYVTARDVALSAHVDVGVPGGVLRGASVCGGGWGGGSDGGRGRAAYAAVQSTLQPVFAKKRRGCDGRGGGEKQTDGMVL